MREAHAMIEDSGSNSCFLACADAAAPIGFIEVSLRAWAEGCRTAPVGYIEGWYVEPEWRRRGAGAALVQAGEAWARLRGCSEMASDAELNNTVSWLAHARLGYQEVERVVSFSKRLEDD
jgi:aminoglycoside 6'-N-acetyltransferase I